MASFLKKIIMVTMLVYMIQFSFFCYYLLFVDWTWSEGLITMNKYIFMNGDLSYKSEWVSLVGYVSMCDVHEKIEFSGIFDDGANIIHNQAAFKNIKHGDLVCLTGDQLTQDFLPNYLPLYEKTDIKFIILTWVRPRSFPLELLITTESFGQLILSNRHILHVYCVDYDGTKWENPEYNEKISGIPLGIDYINKMYKYKYGMPKHPRKQELIFNQYVNRSLSAHNYQKREIKIFRDDMSNEYVLRWENESKKSLASFRKRHNYTASLWLNKDKSLRFRKLRRNIARWNAFYGISASLVHNEMSRKTEKELFSARSKYVFILSPFGGGIDCYRTWEALIFGHIVIVETSPLDNLYRDLPVVIVNNWNEINQENLLLWHKQHFFNHTAQNNKMVRQKLTTKYWIGYMKQLKY